jgi:hypothetical protein
MLGYLVGLEEGAAQGRRRTAEAVAEREAAVAAVTEAASEVVAAASAVVENSRRVRNLSYGGRWVDNDALAALASAVDRFREAVPNG